MTSRLNNSIQKVVVSDSLTVEQTALWSDTRIVKRADANAEVAKLKAAKGGDILVFGSHILWNDLLANGLVDELHLMIGAGVVGEGTRAFERKPSGSLRLLDTVTWKGSNIVLLRYGMESCPASLRLSREAKPPPASRLRALWRLAVRRWYAPPSSGFRR